MASERDKAKGAIVNSAQDDPELDETLSSAHKYQLHLAQENNRHAEAMKARELGFLGRLVGGKENLVTYVASALGVGGFLGAWYYVTPGGEFPPASEKLLAFASACIAFVVGRATKDGGS